MTSFSNTNEHQKPFDLHLPKNPLPRKDIKWNVSGLFTQDEGIFRFINIIKNSFDLPNPITTVHGAPPLLWNSGRITSPLLKADLDRIMDDYAKRDIPLYFTFSNHLLEKEHLSDKLCNYMLDKLNEQGQGGVILSSYLLSEYLRDKYPKMQQIASIIRAALDRGANHSLDIDYYVQQAKKFDCVVIHPDDTFNYPLLKELQDKDKFEIIVNEPCLHGCKMRRIHYGFLASFFKMDIDNEEKSRTFEMNQCISKPLWKQIALHIGQSNSSRTRNCNATPDELDYLYNLGYRRFKLQGRNEIPASFLYDLTKYTLESTHFAPLVYSVLVG